MTKQLFVLAFAAAFGIAHAADVKPAATEVKPAAAVAATISAPAAAEMKTEAAKPVAKPVKKTAAKTEAAPEAIKATMEPTKKKYPPARRLDPTSVELSGAPIRFPAQAKKKEAAASFFHSPRQCDYLILPRM